MTWSIMDRKTNEFKTFEVAVVIAVAIVVFVLSFFLPVLLFFYQFYHS